MPAPVQPIIIIRKKVQGHGGHHGGAWKVAYADFVTAMMALFIVLWLMNSNTKVKEAVSGYFKDPRGFNSQKGTGLAGSGPTMTLSKEDMKDLKDKLQAAIRKSPEFEKLKDNIEMTITGEGLRIELIENEKGIFFGIGDAKPTGIGRELISKLGVELAKLHNPIIVEGHTDSVSYGTDVYTNWELSSDRANSARRILRDSGLVPGRITQVRGFADQQLRLPARPDDAKNRRVSVIVAYPHAPEAPEPAAKDGKEAHGTVKAAAGHEANPDSSHPAGKEVAKVAEAHK
jgi:chemotaxis protein MotB